MKLVNMLVKLTDAKRKDVTTALKDAGITVRSIAILHEEEIQEEAVETEGQTTDTADAAVSANKE